MEDQLPKKKKLSEIMNQAEPPAEPTNPAQTPIEPTPPPATPPAEPPAPTFNPVQYFNEKLQTTFEKEDDLFGHFSSLNEKATRAEQLQAEIESERQRAKELADGSVNDFKKAFGITDDNLKYFKARAEFPEADPSVLDKVLTADFSATLKTDPMQLLVLKERFEHPELSEDKALRRVYKKYGVDTDNTDDNGAVLIDDDTATDILIDAKQAAKSFGEAREKVKLPEIKSREEQEKIATEKYNNIKPLLEKDFKKIPDHLDKVEIFKEKKTKDGKTEKELVFTFSLGDYGKSTHVKKELEKAVDYLSRTMPEYNQEFIEKAVYQSAETLKAQRILSQLPDMFVAAKEQWKAEWMKENNLAEHNPTGVRTEGSPAVPKTEEQRRRDQAEQDFLAKHPHLRPHDVRAR